MNRTTCGLLLALILVGPAPAASIFTVNNLSATIPDNDLNGIQNSQTISGLSGPIADVTVSLNIAGGFNGDLYVFLRHGNTLTVLLNRVGLGWENSVGYPDSGFDLTLADNAANDVHQYRTFNFSLNGGGQVTGTWQPDGRHIDPWSAGSAFANAPRDYLLSGFDGTDPNGTWTLFAADVSAGGVSVLQAWGLAITVVPEPGRVTLLGVALGCASFRCMRCQSRRRHTSMAAVELHRIQ